MQKWIALIQLLAGKYTMMNFIPFNESRAPGSSGLRGKSGQPDAAAAPARHRGLPARFGGPGYRRRLCEQLRARSLGAIKK